MFSYMFWIGLFSVVCGLYFPRAENKCRLKLRKLPKLVKLFIFFLSNSLQSLCGEKAADKNWRHDFYFIFIF